MSTGKKGTFLWKTGNGTSSIYREGLVGGLPGSRLGCPSKDASSSTRSNYISKPFPWFKFDFIKKNLIKLYQNQGNVLELVEGHDWDAPGTSQHERQQLHTRPSSYITSKKFLVSNSISSKIFFFDKIELNKKQANVLEVRPVRCTLGTKGWLGYASACQVRMLCKRCGGRMALSINAWPVKRRVGPLSRIPL